MTKYELPKNKAQYAELHPFVIVPSAPLLFVMEWLADTIDAKNEDYETLMNALSELRTHYPPKIEEHVI